MYTTSYLGIRRNVRCRYFRYLFTLIGPRAELEPTCYVECNAQQVHKQTPICIPVCAVSDEWCTHDAADTPTVTRQETSCRDVLPRVAGEGHL